MICILKYIISKFFTTILFLLSLTTCSIAELAPQNYDPWKDQYQESRLPNTNNPISLNNPFPTNSGVSRSNDLPYKLIPDTIAALTCDQTVRIDGFPYTLSVGSYREPYGGLRLSADFVKNNDIERGTSSQRVRQLLEASPLKKTRAQLSMRYANNIAQIISFNNHSVLSWFSPFDNPDNLDRLSRQGVSFTTHSSDARTINNNGRFTARLRMLGTDFIRNSDIFLENGAGLIRLVYSLNNNNPIFGSDGRAYGRGYTLSFNDSHKADFLTNVQEEDLRTSELEGRWECPIRFMIHDHTTENGSRFNMTKEQYRNHFNQNLDAEKVDELLRKEGFCYTTGSQGLTSQEQNFFREEFGDLQRYFVLGTSVIFEDRNGEEVAVDTQFPCLIPRGQRCYPTSNQYPLYRIEFDPEKDCSGRITKTQAGHSLEERFYKVCPAYLSVCFRTGD